MGCSHGGIDPVSELGFNPYWHHNKGNHYDLAKGFTIDSEQPRKEARSKVQAHKGSQSQQFQATCCSVLSGLCPRFWGLLHLGLENRSFPAGLGGPTCQTM